VIVQWCCKGIGEIDEGEVERILAGGRGLVSRLWQQNPVLSYTEALSRLNERFLDLHVNHYDEIDPVSGRRVSCVTPFISLSAGCIERDAFTETHVVNPARRTALAFATDKGRREGWLFTCYVIVAVNRSTPIPSVAEEVRDLNQNRAYSHYWAEGEVAAKINVPSPQILCVERWGPGPGDEGLVRHATHMNHRYVAPRSLLNLRGMIG
jgi:hypothetical protein